MASEQDDKRPIHMTSSRSTSPFDRIKRTDPDGVEFWSSRELASELGYTDYRNFEDVVEKARTACRLSGNPPDDHLVDTTEMIEVGKGAKRELDVVWLSRYGCYLVAQSAESSKPQVAHAKTYFAIQTRRQEIEDDRRLRLRDEMRKHNRQLAGAAKDAGIEQPKDYAIFQNHGYMGLYGGKTARDLKQMRGLKRNEDVLDHMGSAELAANLFRATQTEEKLKREGIKGKAKANAAHKEVGQKVRKLMIETGGTKPEDMPAVDSVKKLEAEKRKRLKDDSTSD